jgi:hypothetical protein
MPGKNKTPLLGWHPRDPRIVALVRKEAEDRGVTVSTILNEMAEAYFGQRPHRQGGVVSAVSVWSENTTEGGA